MEGAVPPVQTRRSSSPGRVSLPRGVGRPIKHDAKCDPQVSGAPAYTLAVSSASSNSDHVSLFSNSLPLGSAIPPPGSLVASGREMAPSSGRNALRAMQQN
ncbi:unnamed protein product [Prorocentrum cordatum]|uniref:Uncharacterized protein n=1 Tax=Prorocentrum cordatum TaxID=2364126 RepID=A0ABN9Y4L6_9DINO|nr:unnamed protein product [Polarella glacialis]